MLLSFMCIITSVVAVIINFCYSKRGNFHVGVIYLAGVIFKFFVIVSLSRKSLHHENNILYILLWKLHWYPEINTQV